MKEFVTEMGQFIASKAKGVHQKKFDQRGLKNTLRLDINKKDDVNLFNEIYVKFRNSELTPIQRTPSGGIAQCKANRRGVWDYQICNVGVTLTTIIEGYTFCITIASKDDTKEKNMRGMTAFHRFMDKCLEYGIDLHDYEIENGAEVKLTIPSPKISMKFIMTKDDAGLENCHHLDFHNSYPAGLCNTHPEFRQVVEPIYETRKTNPENKAILNLTIGYMQSLMPRVKARWAHLSKDAIVDNNNRIDELSKRLTASGRDVIGYNTDGIWYQGEIYHGEGEGTKLGEWSNDHVNCTFRSKSDGAYEYIENGEYHAVLRGRTNYDLIEPRDNWKWGDIYQDDLVVLKYKWDDATGVVPAEVE